MQHGISKLILQRLPIYLDYLKSLSQDITHISATAIAAALGFGEVQVRKDLAAVSSLGKPKVGYVVIDLIDELETFLGFKNVDNSIIVGTGKLGLALLDCGIFNQYGLDIVAGFDIKQNVIGKSFSGKKIFHLEKLPNLCHRMNIKVAIITVPVEAAQSVCDLLVENNVKAIMNFAPIHLTTTKDVIIHNENIASSLALLSKNLVDRINFSH